MMLNSNDDNFSGPGLSQMQLCSTAQVVLADMWMQLDAEKVPVRDRCRLFGHIIGHLIGESSPDVRADMHWAILVEMSNTIATCDSNKDKGGIDLNDLTPVGRPQ